MVSKIVRDNLTNLQQIAESNPKSVKKILKFANSGLLEAIRQCIINVLKGIVELSDAQRDVLAKYRTKLRKIKNPKTSKAQKRKLIQTGGSFVVPLLSALLPHIVGGIASLIRKSKSQKTK